MKAKTKKFETAVFLATEQDIAAYFDAAIEDGDPSVIVRALGAIAKSRGMARVARESGLRRESLYKALSPTGNPEFATVIKVMRALGIRLHAHVPHAV